MSKKRISGLFILFGVVCFLLIGVTGCATVSTREVIRDRVDQDLTGGNRGYLSGNVPPQEVTERKKTRKTYEVNVELFNPFQFGKEKVEEQTSSAYDYSPTEIVDTKGIVGGIQVETQEMIASDILGFESYTVRKGDTLQKISVKFYGTSRKWQKIYDANREVLKAPDRLYPGQELNIPLE